MKNKKGFTLIELLAVIIILGVLLFVAVPSISNLINNSKIETYKQNAKLFLNRAKEMYILEESSEDKYYTLNDINVSESDTSPFGSKYDFNKSFIYIKNDKSCIQLIDKENNILYSEKLEEYLGLDLLNVCIENNSIDNAAVKKINNINDKRDDFFDAAEILALNLNDDIISLEKYGTIDTINNTKFKNNFNIGDNVFSKHGDTCAPYTVLKQNSKNSLILFPRIILDTNNCKDINKNNELLSTIKNSINYNTSNNFLVLNNNYRNVEEEKLQNHLNGNGTFSSLSIKQLYTNINELLGFNFDSKEAAKIFKRLIYPIKSCNQDGMINFNNYTDINLAFWVSDFDECFMYIPEDSPNQYELSKSDAKCSVVFIEDDNLMISENALLNTNTKLTTAGGYSYNTTMILPIILYADEENGKMVFPLYKDQNCEEQYIF